MQAGTLVVLISSLEDLVMKQYISKVAVLGFVVAFAVSSAVAKGRKTLTIYEKARVNDVVLEPGDYKVEVVENGKNTADVMIYKGKQLVAKAAAQPEQLERKAERNSVRFALEGDKAPKIIELRLSGDSQSYKLGDGTQMSQKGK
jgi:hypothetical protein